MQFFGKVGNNEKPTATFSLRILRQCRLHLKKASDVLNAEQAFVVETSYSNADWTWHMFDDVGNELYVDRSCGSPINVPPVMSSERSQEIAFTI
jgi:hypothetical protein